MQALLLPIHCFLLCLVLDLLCSLGVLSGFAIILLRKGEFVV